MGLDSVLAFGAGFFSSALALAVMLRRRHSVASWCFCVGMLLFATENVLYAISGETLLPEGIAFWQKLILLLKPFLLGVWLCFSLTFSRGNYRESLAKSRLLLLAVFLLPTGIVMGFRDQLLQVSSYTEHGQQQWWVGFSEPGEVLNALLLVVSVLVLMNLERTFRSAVGRMQWRIKFLVLGLGVIFGARIYTRSQALLFSGHTLQLMGIETCALLIGCTLIAIGYLRAGFTELDVYPSRAVLQTSVTVLLAGGYLFVVGVLAQIVAHIGGSSTFQIQTFLILLAIALLAILLLSARARHSLQRFVSRHFKRPQHDFREMWTLFTKCTSNLLDRRALCGTVTKLIARSFNVLSVTMWLFDEENQRLLFASSTSHQPDRVDAPQNIPMSASDLAELRRSSLPFDLEKKKTSWAEGLKKGKASHFRTGGDRLCIPLQAGERLLGIAVLADRVAGIPFTTEELDLLKCIGDQIAASLLNLNLNEEVLRGKELEALQTVSAFFVHDLKNAASTLSLMLQNLPVHFDDPAFREDALRGIAETVKHINQLIARASVLGAKLELNVAELDLNSLVNEALQGFNGEPGIQWVKDLQPVPTLVADREKLRSVLTNLLLNARDAINGSGEILIKTKQQGDWAAFAIVDNGTGMEPTFLRDSLFRPFRTTKKKGLGIGMFQSKMIVEAHRGTIQVESEIGKGTTVQIRLPLK